MTKVNNNPVRQMLVSLAIGLILSLLFFGVGVQFLLKKEANSELFGGALLLLAFALLIVTFQRITRVFRGKLIFEADVVMSLPGLATYEFSIPTKLNGGRLIVFFRDTPEKYYGKISFIKSDGSSVSANLPRLEPRRIQVPKWLPTTDAGGTYENWPRRTGQATDPVELQFFYTIKPDEKLRLQCELESNFKGTTLEKRFQTGNTETLRICIRELKY